MTYRDDREALHHRVAKLEQELTDARREGAEQGRDEAQARANALEQRLADMRGELAKMTAELHALRGDEPPKPGPKSSNAMIVVLASLAVVLLAGGALTAMLRMRSPTPSVPMPSDIDPVAPVVVTPPVPVPATPEAPRAIPLEPIPQPQRTTTARWVARVAKAEGLALGPGSTCTVEATIATTDTNAVVKQLSVQCGATYVYRSTDRLNGMSQGSNDAREVLGTADEKTTFTLAYRDLGSRTGERAQIDLDTKQGQATVFRDTIPRSRVDLTLPSASTPAAPLALRLRRTGLVKRVSGKTPVKEGAPCVLRAMATGKGKDCVADVKCAGLDVWLATAPVQCTYEGGRPVTVGADDGTSGNLAIADKTLTVKAKASELEVTLDDAP